MKNNDDTTIILAYLLFVFIMSVTSILDYKLESDKLEKRLITARENKR